jgi:hypothetical protein
MWHLRIEKYELRKGVVGMSSPRRGFPFRGHQYPESSFIRNPMTFVMAVHFMSA